MGLALNTLLRGTRTLFTLMSTALILIILIALTYFSRPLALSLSRLWSRVILRLLGCTYNVIGRENLPLSGAIIAAQHTSLLDTFIYPALLPSKTIYYAKSELKKVPILGLALRRLGHQFVDRGKGSAQLNTLREDALTFPDDVTLFIHPQGTRRADEELGALKVGVAVLAQATGLPIIPVISRGGSPLWGRGDFSPRSGHVQVTILPPIDVNGAHERTPRALTDELALYMQSEIERRATAK